MYRISLVGVMILGIVLYCKPIMAISLEDLGDLLARADVAGGGMVNQIDEFTRHQALVQRILAVSSSTTSIVCCLISMYFFLAIDPRRLVFRHQLIFFLLFFDLLKACILLLYPARVLSNYTSYFNARFCHVVGFFTATAIEGADFAILTFAIHTYLLIFKPSLNVRVGNSRRTEGGLYTYRYYVYGISFLIPIILASLAFVETRGYESFVCWCYLPQYPVWYRMVLSWVPRYLILLTIFFCYASIYYHVLRQIRHLGGVFTTASRKRKLVDLVSEKPSFFSALSYFFSTVKRKLFPQLVIPDQDKPQSKPNELTSHKSNAVSAKSRHSKENSNDNAYDDEDDGDDDDEADIAEGDVEDIDVEDIDDMSSDDDDDMNDNNQEINESNIENTNHPNPVILADQVNLANSNSNLDPHGTDIHLENLKNFRKRQRIIKKQMKSIFIYPLAYIFIWLFPFILYVTQVNYERHHKPIYFLNCLGAFMQPFNGFVDSIVFFVRETPWKYTVMNKFKKDHSERMGTILNKHYHQQRHRDTHGSVGYGSHHNPSISHGHNQSIRSHSFYDSSLSNPANSRNGSGVGRMHSISHQPSQYSHSHHSSFHNYHNNSLSANLNVDISKFKKWRKVLNDLRLPLFQLPTEKNLDSLQDQFMDDKLNNKESPEDIEMSDQTRINDGDDQKLDFSNVLKGSLVEDEFRSTLENFSLNFNSRPTSVSNSSNNDSNLHPNTKRLSNSSMTPSFNNPASPTNRKHSISNKSIRGRQYSVDPNEPVIVEGKLYNAAGSPSTPVTKQSPTNPNSHPKSSRNSYNSGNALTARKGGSSGSSTPNNKLSKGTLDSRLSRPSISTRGSDGEMDFLEFLKKGPP